MAPASTLSQDLNHVHRIITRSLIIDTEKGSEFLESGFHTDLEMHSFLQFNHRLISMIRSHHQAEDLIAFPAYRKMLPLVPYAQLNAEHRRIDQLTALIPEVIIDISEQASAYGLRVLIIVLVKILKILTAHTVLEESYFCGEVMTARANDLVEHDIGESLGGFRHAVSKPPYWVVPFLLHNPRQPDRSSLTFDFPLKVMDELFQKNWSSEISPAG